MSDAQVVGEPKKLYHVTPMMKLESILKHGLVPLIGERSALAGEASSNVYLFTSAEAYEAGLMNWLGEEFESEEMVVLEFDYVGIFGDASAGFELVCPHAISADLIERVLDENLRPINAAYLQQGSRTVTGFNNMTRPELSSWYIENVGYDLGEEDPDMTLESYRDLCIELYERLNEPAE